MYFPYVQQSHAHSPFTKNESRLPFQSTYRNDEDRKKELAKRIQDRAIVKTELSFGADLNDDEIDVLVVKRTYELNFEKIRKSKPRFVVVPYAGPPQSLLTALAQIDPEIQVFNSNHNAPSTAEMAIALVLCASKNILRGHDELSKSNNWLGRGMYPKRKGGPLEKPIPQLYLNKKTACVLGLGSVGRRVAKTLRMMGMNVIGTRRSATTRDEDGFEIWSGELGELFKLRKPNVVVLCVPGTSETVNLIRSKELNLLPNNAVLVNMARGQVVNEKDIYEHLQSHPDFSFASDVWWRYPTVDDDPSRFAPSNFDFSKLNNAIVMSPHRGGGIGVDEIEDERFDKISDLISRIGSGKNLPRCMNLKVGY